MSLSSRGATVAQALQLSLAQATEAKSLHPWCVLVSAEAELIPALGTLADLLLHSSPQPHLGEVNIYTVNLSCSPSTAMRARPHVQLLIGIMSSSAPPPGVANAHSMDTLESTPMSFVSLTL